MYKYVRAVNKKRGHEFEREEGGVYGSLWWEENEGGCGAIML